MNNKNLINTFSKVASIFVDDAFLDCIIVVSSDCIRLTNWKHGIVTTVALCHISKVCASFGLVYYIDFDSKKVVIYE